MILRAPRIERLRESRIDTFRTDSATLWSLGDDNCGVVITRCEAPSVIIPIFRAFDRDAGDFANEPVFLLMSYSKDLAAEVRTGLGSLDGSLERTGEPPPACMSSRLIHGTIESVRRHLRDQPPIRPVAGAMVFDPPALVQQARGYPTSYKPHDRPEFVARIQECLMRGSWRPPLLILTSKAPRELDAEAIKRAYRVEGLRYVDGRELRVGRCDPPAISGPA